MIDRFIKAIQKICLLIWCTESTLRNWCIHICGSSYSYPRLLSVSHWQQCTNQITFNHENPNWFRRLFESILNVDAVLKAILILIMRTWWRHRRSGSKFSFLRFKMSGYDLGHSSLYFTTSVIPFRRWMIRRWLSCPKSILCELVYSMQGIHI